MYPSEDFTLRPNIFDEVAKEIQAERTQLNRTTIPTPQEGPTVIPGKTIIATYNTDEDIVFAPQKTVQFSSELYGNYLYNSRGYFRGFVVAYRKVSRNSLYTVAQNNIQIAMQRYMANRTNGCSFR